MTPCDLRDASLRRLPPLAPDPDRAERVRVRCRTQLGRNRRRTARSAVMTGFVWHVLGPAIVGGVCALYAAALVVTTLSLHGLFH